MRAHKDSDSPSGYDREVIPRRSTIPAETIDAAGRRLDNERWQRRLLPCLSVVNPQPCDFEGCVE